MPCWLFETIKSPKLSLTRRKRYFTSVSVRYHSSRACPFVLKHGSHTYNNNNMLTYPHRWWSWHSHWRRSDDQWGWLWWVHSRHPHVEGGRSRRLHGRWADSNGLRRWGLHGGRFDPDRGGCGQPNLSGADYDRGWRWEPDLSWPD